MSEISVIIPVYNAEKTIIKCLDSLKAQTFTDFEVLLINDGSKDSSAEICKKYSEEDPRFKLINQENSGPSSARNRGIDEATSKYLAFVDSDDYIEADMLNELYRAAENSAADVTVCNFCLEYKDKPTKEYTYNYKPGVYKGESLRKIVIEALDAYGRGNIPPYSWVRLVRRDCLNNPKLRFNTKIHRSEDYLLWNKVFFNIKCLCLITDKALYHYVAAGPSITRGYVKDYWKMSKIIYNELSEDIKSDTIALKRLGFMLMHRACLALNLSVCAGSRKAFINDVNEVITDNDFKKVVASIPLSEGMKKDKWRYLLFKFHLNFIIKIIYNYKYIKFNRKNK